MEELTTSSKIMPDSDRKDYALLHFTVFLFGFTGILGKLISLPAESLVWYRMAIAVLGILTYMIFGRNGFRVSLRDLRNYFFVGFIIAMHWVYFYKSIKAGSVSVAVVCLSASTIFTAFLEPLFFRRRIRVHEVFIGVLITLALYFIFRIEERFGLSMVYGLISAFLAAVFPVLNGILTKGGDSYKITFYELTGGWFFLGIFLFFSGESGQIMVNVSLMDWFYLVLLGIVCTTFTFVSSLKVMKKISPYTVVLAINLEPVYTIFLARLIFGEKEAMTMGFYFGTLIIIACIFLSAALSRRYQSRLLKAG
jgi:drug/metabolite transporter (DMT)-like permease